MANKLNKQENIWNCSCFIYQKKIWFSMPSRKCMKDNKCTCVRHIDNCCAFVLRLFIHCHTGGWRNSKVTISPLIMWMFGYVLSISLYLCFFRCLSLSLSIYLFQSLPPGVCVCVCVTPSIPYIFSYPIQWNTYRLVLCRNNLTDEYVDGWEKLNTKSSGMGAARKNWR